MTAKGGLPASYHGELDTFAIDVGFTFTASGGKGPYTWTFLQFAEQAGTIPGSLGMYDATVSASERNLRNAVDGGGGNQLTILDSPGPQCGANWEKSTGTKHVSA